MQQETKPLGELVVVTGPSGVGKTTAVELAIAEATRTGAFTAARLVTMTTRARSSEEQDGVDYHFVTRERFLEIAADDGFLEHEENYGPGNLYGSPLRALQRMRTEYDVTFAVLDPKGARTVRRKTDEGTLDALIVALTAEPAILEERMRRRAADRPNLEARIAGIAEDVRISAEAAHFQVASVEGQKTGAMHRILELIAYRRDLRDAQRDERHI